MHFLEHYYKNIIQYDLLNKFHYLNLKKIPEIKKIVLNFKCTNSNIKDLSTSLLALELVTFQKGVITISNKSNILLKIRKGNPVGCKITLQKRAMFSFLTKLFTEIFPRLKNFESLGLKQNRFKNYTVTYQLTNALIFFELEHNYSLFSALKNLNIVIVTSTSIQNELLFLFNSFKIPAINKSQVILFNSSVKNV